MATTATLIGTGDAPLIATRSYAFRRGLDPDGAPQLTIPADDRDVQDPEQRAYLVALFAALGLPAATDHPGAWTLADPAALARVWSALTAAIGPPATHPPSATATRHVPRAQAPVVSAALTRRYLDLVDAVLGLAGPPFQCADSRIDNNGFEVTRHERWTRGDVTVLVEATGVESGYGVHGETCDYTIHRPRSEAGASMYANIDMRSGGSYSVTVTGVRDARALVDAFVAA